MKDKWATAKWDILRRSQLTATRRRCRFAGLEMIISQTHVSHNHSCSSKCSNIKNFEKFLLVFHLAKLKFLLIL